MWLRWDLANESHVTHHGVSRAQIDDMIDLGFTITVANPTGNRQRPLVIGPTSRGRLLTLVVQRVGTSDDYVPVTCWPSNEREQTLYWRRLR
jgi:hypothetical protein